VICLGNAKTKSHAKLKVKRALLEDNMKKLMLVTLLAASVLSGCGKKKNNEPVVNGVASVGSASIGLQNGSCYNMNQVGFGSGANLTFQGQGWISPYTGAIQAQVQGASVGFPGVSYSRSNAAGDTLQVYVSGQTVYAYANLSSNTVSWIKYFGNTYGQAGSICGLYIDSPISGSNMTMSARMLSGNGSYYAITL
jgi:hypothetical protein